MSHVVSFLSFFPRSFAFPLLRALTVPPSPPTAAIAVVFSLTIAITPPSSISAVVPIAIVPVPPVPPFFLPRWLFLRFLLFRFLLFRRLCHLSQRKRIFLLLRLHFFKLHRSVSSRTGFVSVFEALMGLEFWPGV